MKHLAIELKRPASNALADWALILVLASLVVMPSLSHAQFAPGTTFVTDRGFEITGRGALFSVDPTTGVRTVVSDFGNPAQGPLGNDPFALAIETSGHVLIVDIGPTGMNLSGVIFRVDPSTGKRTVLSDFGNPAQGVIGAVPAGLALESSGNLLVVDAAAGPTTLGALFRVDRSTGARTLISDFADSRQGPYGAYPVGVVVEDSGDVLVMDSFFLFRIDPATGARKIVSDFNNTTQGPIANRPAGPSLTIEATNTVLLTDFAAGTNGGGTLLRVDTSTGARTLVSDFGKGAQGAIGEDPFGVAIEDSGSLLVIDPGSGTSGALFRVDPSSGARTFISGFGNPRQGPLGNKPSAVAIVRQPSCNGQAATSGCTVNGVANQACLGTQGPDVIIGTAGADVIVGLADNDILSGGLGSDLICGGSGNDTLLGNRSRDQLFGEDGDDTLRGGRGGDALDGGNGGDTCLGGAGSDGAASCETTASVP